MLGLRGRAGRHAGVGSEPGEGVRLDGTASRVVLVTRLVTVGLWLLVLAGPVLGGLALAVQSVAPGAREGGTPPAAATERSVSGLVPGEFAVRFVSAWLSASEGDEESLAGFVAEVPPLPEAAVMRLAGGPRLVDVAQLSPGSWSVTVSGEVELAVAGGEDEWSGPVTRFWQVGVLASPNPGKGSTASAVGLVATSLPAEVAGPGRVDAAELAYGSTVDGAPGPLGEAVASFLGLFLAGSAEFERYVSPGANLSAPQPIGYAGVEVTAMAATGPDGEPVDLTDLERGGLPRDGRRVEVMATVQPRTEAGEAPPQQYVLALKARAGRWEVAAIEPAARVHDEDDQAGEGREAGGR